MVRFEGTCCNKHQENIRNIQFLHILTIKIRQGVPACFPATDSNKHLNAARNQNYAFSGNRKELFEWVQYRFQDAEGEDCETSG